jgi:hypothetical protein
VLAFVFWHWPRAEVGRAEYEARLADFHDTLRRHPPEGFLHSAAFRGGSCSWGSETGPTYEDWYVTRGTDALDPLEHGAVHGACQPPHDAVAKLAAGGCAGLYLLRAGTLDLARVRHSLWVSKPEGVTYAELDAALAPAPGVSLWMRKMVLGPTPEFCLMSAEPLGLPDDRFQGVARILEPVAVLARSA